MKHKPTWRRSLIMFVTIVGLLAVTACGEDDRPVESVTDCGACADGEVCGADGKCAPFDPTCLDTCDSLGAACGDVCGQTCGACIEGAMCREGACVCQPTCLEKTCGAPDGCGGTCDPCPADENCPDCILRAHVIKRTYDGGRLDRVTIAVDYNPAEGAELPGIADLRFDLSGPAKVVRTGIAKRLHERGKTLHRDGLTGEAWTMLGEEKLQLLLLSQTGKEKLDAGRLALVELQVGSEEEPALVPVVISLIEREQIFAPKAADEALWTSSIGDPISVWPEVGHE